MTPPRSPAPLGSPANPPLYLEPGDLPNSAPAKPALKTSDSYVPMDAGSDNYKSSQDLLNAIGDEQLFGSVANAKYQPERNKQYLKVTLAIMEVRKYLRGDEKDGQIAAKKIEFWLNDYDLLTDKLVAHQARVNLIKALKRAPKDPSLDSGVSAMLSALTATYNPKPTNVPVAAPGATADAAPVSTPAVADTDLKDFFAKFSDQALFGDKFSDYNAKRNKEYLAVTSAILDIKKFLRGDESNSDYAKAKILVWLSDSTLLTDPVLHAVRKKLIQALNHPPQQSAAWNQGVAGLFQTLNSYYDKAGAAPEPVVPPSDLISESKPFTEYTASPKSNLKEKREDDIKSFQSGLSYAVRPAFQRVLKNRSDFSLHCKMTVSADDANGAILSVTFKDLKPKGSISNKELRDFLDNVASQLRSRFRFKPGTFPSGIGGIETSLNMVAQ